MTLEASQERSLAQASPSHASLAAPGHISKSRALSFLWMETPARGPQRSLGGHSPPPSNLQPPPPECCCVPVCLHAYNLYPITIPETSELQMSCPLSPPFVRNLLLCHQQLSGHPGQKVLPSKYPVGNHLSSLASSSTSLSAFRLLRSQSHCHCPRSVGQLIICPLDPWPTSSLASLLPPAVHAPHLPPECFSRTNESWSSFLWLVNILTPLLPPGQPSRPTDCPYWNFALLALCS